MYCNYFYRTAVFTTITIIIIINIIVIMIISSRIEDIHLFITILRKFSLKQNDLYYCDGFSVISHWNINENQICI